MTVPDPRAILALLALSALAAPAAAQETIERTPNLSGGWVGQTGMLYANLPVRLASIDTGESSVLTASPALDLGVGLPANLLAGLRFAPESPVVAGSPTEWEVFARYQPFAQARGLGADVAATLAWNGAAGSLDGEVSLARWLGPLRAIGAVRGFTDASAADGARLAVAGGAVLHPLPGRAPLALVGDVAALSGRGTGEEVAWSAGVQLGVPFTGHTLSLFATNTASPTLQGASRGAGRTRLGLELTVPVAVARFVGWTVPRAAAAEAVVPAADPSGPVVRLDMARYLFLPKRIEIPAGGSVEWVNVDEVMHTVSSEDGAWRSGAIEPGERWRARFDRPGRYLYYCGPHPFMKGEVLVR
jgi:plastocyanin